MIKQNNVHIGLAIENKLRELKMSKTEFGHRIGVAQSNVNRILERKSIDTDKLVQISQALKFNFFTLYCDENININAVDHSAFSISSSAMVLDARGNDSALALKVVELEKEVKNLSERLADKQMIIDLLKKKQEERDDTH